METNNGLTMLEKQEKIIEDFSVFDDWMDKYAYLIELGKSLPPIDSKYKTEQYQIKGCQSQVWIYAEYKDGRVFYTADSDAVITKGIVNLLIQVLSGSTPDEIISNDMSFINAVGLKEHLSPTRANGLLAMLKQLKLFAMAFKAKNNQ